MANRPTVVTIEPANSTQRAPSTSMSTPLASIMGMRARLNEESSPATWRSPRSRRRARFNLMLPKRASTRPKTTAPLMVTAVTAASLLSMVSSGECGGRVGPSGPAYGKAPPPRRGIRPAGPGFRPPTRPPGGAPLRQVIRLDPPEDPILSGAEAGGEPAAGRRCPSERTPCRGRARGAPPGCGRAGGSGFSACPAAAAPLY